MVDLRSAVDLGAQLFHVVVYDSPERPELFPDAEAAKRWAQANRPDWKAYAEPVRHRRLARFVHDNDIRQARAEGWYQPGPIPDPIDPTAPDPEYVAVGVAHAGLTVYIYANQSDAVAGGFLSQLSPHHSYSFKLHAVRMRR